MYEFVRGPMMWIAFAVCILGLMYQAYRLIRLTRCKEESYYTSRDKSSSVSERLLQFFKGRWLRWIRNWSITVKGTVIGLQPLLAVLTFVFHVCLIVTPLFLMAHNILLFESWQWSLPSFSEFTTDILTIIFLICAAVFLVRRILVPRVRAVSSLWDYILLLITLAPFLTGYLAYHQLVQYETIIVIHILAGELMLISMGVTKLGHMIFFFFVRLFIGSEYSFGGGTRTW
jgi:nitrate reductase gamma subunit